MNYYNLLLVIIIVFLPILFIFKKNTKIDFTIKGIEFHNNDKIFLQNIHGIRSIANESIRLCCLDGYRYYYNQTGNRFKYNY